MPFDALLVVSFGGPEGPEDVMPFLRNVVRGRDVPEERLARVAEQYHRFGGRSPINDHNRRLVADLKAAIAGRGSDLPVYWGNRNWHPLLADTVAAMRADGVRRAAAFVTSAYSSYSSCRQYIEDIDAAIAATGDGSLEIVKLRPCFNHPGFVEPLADGLRSAIGSVPPGTPVLMTAHSIPTSMAETCDYERQLKEVAGLVASGAGLAGGPGGWQLVFQSRSGPPGQPWLGPDVNEAIESLGHGTGPAGGTGSVVVVPIGFVSEHMEVVHDLDTVAAETAGRRGLTMVRTPTPGTDPRFVEMVLDLVDEMDRGGPGRSLGRMGPAPCPCLPGCCPAPSRAGAPGRPGAEPP